MKLNSSLLEALKLWIIFEHLEASALEPATAFFTLELATFTSPSLLIGTFTLLLMVTPKLHFILPDFDLLVCIWNIEHPPFSFPRLLRWACKGALHSSYFRKKKWAGWSPGARQQPIATLQAAVPIHPLNTWDRFQGKANHWIRLLNRRYLNIAITESFFQQTWIQIEKSRRKLHHLVVLEL